MRAPARINSQPRGAALTRPVSRSGSFSPGDRVRHSQFGEGIVVTSQMRGGDEELIVAFTGQAGVKRLVASLAGLKRVSRPE